MVATAGDFARMGALFLDNKPKAISTESFKSEFGVTPPVCSYLWKKLSYFIPASSEPEHLIWALYHARHYPKDKQFAHFTGHHVDTLRQHIDPIRKGFVKLLPRIIRFERRFEKDKGRTCLTYEDGIDFLIMNPPKEELDLDPELPYDRKWYSHKWKRAGVRYAIVTCIQTGYIVAVHGPYPPGRWPDLKIFRHRTKPLLGPNEQVEADRGYRGDDKTRIPSDFCCQSERRAKERVAARHEAVNKRLRIFDCMNERFRHHRSKHKEFMALVAVCTQLDMEFYGPPFEVSY